MARFGCLARFLVCRKKRSKAKIVKPSDEDVGKENHFDASVTFGTGDPETAYEGGDEHEEIISTKKDFSDFNLEDRAADNEFNCHGLVGTNMNYHVAENYSGIDEGIIQVLNRSCSNMETQRRGRSLMPPMKSHSYDEKDHFNGIQSSRPSTSQVLPSTSRKLWWKLFQWSHMNLHKSPRMKSTSSSDTLEPSCTADKKNKKAVEEPMNGSPTDPWSQTQLVAFSSGSSSLDRTNAWVNSLEFSPYCYSDDDGEETGDVGNHSSTSFRVVEEAKQANNIIQSLNSFSSMAQICCMGLKFIPTISTFSSLRSVNLSGNFIIQISRGVLPKSLQTLDLSRNKITAIEGLQDLTRLRVLNLSYNRISRIGHGLSNCFLIKELYLAGNKISDMEGLHRLLKLTVLDLSFNKITTVNAFRQLVAHYNSLSVLNLIGNPIQKNVGDDQLRRSVLGLLPQLTYLNKQPIKPQRLGEVATDSIAKAVLVNVGGRSSLKRLSRRGSLGPGFMVKERGRGGQKSSRHGLKTLQQHSSSRRKEI